MNIGKTFLSPKKIFEDRGKRAFKRSSTSRLPLSKSKRSATISPSPIDGATPCSSTTDDDQRSLLTSSVGEPLLSDYSVHELAGYEDTCDSLVNTACTTRIEFLENESRYLNSLLLSKKADFSRIEQICHNDSLVRFYTGFASYEILLLLVEFLGPAIHYLKYWGESERKTSHRRKKKALDPLNQLFLTLVKLRLNLKVKDLALRFGISTGMIYHNMDLFSLSAYERNKLEPYS